jgi:hypothetical protein
LGAAIKKTSAGSALMVTRGIADFPAAQHQKKQNSGQARCSIIERCRANAPNEIRIRARTGKTIIENQ